MKNNIRPAEGWLFLEPRETPTGIIRRVSVDMDICDIGKWVDYDEPKPITLPHLGYIAVRTENIKFKEEVHYDY